MSERSSLFAVFWKSPLKMNGKVIQYANLARDVGVDDKTIAEYFQILENTF